MTVRAKSTPDYLAPYFEAIRRGIPFMRAANLAEIDYSRITRLRQSAAWFRTAEEKARADAIAERVERIRKAGQAGTWTADAWWLERQEPSDWKLRDEHSITAESQPVPIRVIDSRVAAAAAFAAGSDADRPASGEAASTRDGPPVGKNDTGGHVGP